MHNFIGYDNFVGWLYCLVLVQSQFCMLKYFMRGGSLAIIGFHQNDLKLSWANKSTIAYVTTSLLVCYSGLNW